MVKEGRSDSEIRAFMAERYGDFISYKPPVRPSTWILWFFPPILLLMVLIGWAYKTRHNTAKTLQSDTKPLSADEEARLQALLTKHSDNKDKS